MHRDVKPANILVDASADRPDHVYLSDFGVSKGATSSASLTGTGHFLGTPDYSAPEQIQGLAVNGRTDQYALACVAYQLLTGEVPFERDQGMAVLLAHLSEPPPSLAARRLDLPEAADAVLARGMAKAPEKRYESCRDFADALRETLGLAPYHLRSTALAPDHAQTQIASPPPEFTGLAAVVTIDTSPALPASPEAVPSMSLRVVEEDVPAVAAVATAASVRPAWRPQRIHAIILVGAVLLVAAIVASVLASSPSSPPTLSYSQFLTDMSAHAVETVDLAPSAGGTSSGTLINGATFTVVIPSGARQSLLTELHRNGVQVTGAGSSGS